MRVEEPLKKKHAFFNHLNEIGYEREYDKEGNLITKKGEGILFMKTQSVKLNRNDTFNIHFYLASPDWVTREFYVNKYDSEGNLLKSEQKEIHEEYNAVFYQTTFREAGKYKIEGVSKFIDELIDNVKIDTVELYVQVGSKYSI
ncbi:hypothetical protein [Fulvivirga kasyanovii]|uniref:Uncharacterized protein n=1 Tax=Fulvivirga kasyanovii TaxID=396812 RepID=A0ABW9RHZ8_9BACT|nr:hypothetical protein [Fulvivirga kasyanovii]MTI23684.1 hypothetical protein [Fulvivirga kasyanovii]